MNDPACKAGKFKYRRTRDPLLFYSVAALIYLILTFLSMKLINRLEVKYSRGF